MKKVVFTALCIASVVALPGCWCQKEEVKPAEQVKQEAPVATEETKPAEQAAEAAKPAEQAPEAPKAEEVPAKM